MVSTASLVSFISAQHFLLPACHHKPLDGVLFIYYKHKYLFISITNIIFHLHIAL